MSTGWTDFTQKITDEYSLANLVQTATVALGAGRSFTLAPKRSYAGLLVCTSQPSAADLTLTVVTGAGVLPHYGLRQPATVANQTVSWWVPIPLDPQIAYLVHLASSVNQATPGAVYVYGVGALPSALVLRGDGRPYPIGTYSATLFASVKTGTLIAAPAAPFRILLASVSLRAVGKENQFIAGTRGGGGYRLAAIVATNDLSDSGSIPPGGILLDPGTPVTLDGTAALVQQARAIFTIVT